jgi:hypothetical protein
MYLIMTNGSLQEWMKIKELLNTFYNASGLLINWDKSTFHFANLQDQTLALLKDILPHTFVHLSEGFKYLGSFLKSDSLKPTRVILGAKFRSWAKLGGLEF